MEVWRRTAVILKFPAYKLEDLDDAPVQVWTAYRMVTIAETTQSGKR